LLHAMERGSQLVEGYFSGFEAERPLTHIVVRSKVPNVFNVGGDLGYFQRLISTQDRARLTEYARAAINVGYRNYVAHNLRGVTTVALLEGDALGGGFESALSCDVVIAERHVRAGFPEVLFDMFPGMGGLSFLSRRVNRSVVNDLTRTGRLCSATELFELGVIDQVVETGEGMDAVARLIRQRERQHGAHSAMNEVDRLLRPVTLSELNDVVRLWVDCALRLSPRGFEWMRRLHKQQISAFGVGLAVVPNENRIAA
jgi:DSF synthase